MHDRVTVDAALRLARDGRSLRSVGRAVGVNHETVGRWVRGDLPHSCDPDACDRCGARHDLPALPAEYVHLLGLYLGDGCVSAHARGVFHLRIVLDRRYPAIVAAAAGSVGVVIGSSAVHGRPDNCVEVSSYSRQWPCLLPQHGPGPKHRRPIVLSEWQRELVERWPEQLVRGLIESDGCRFTNTGRNGWSAARCAFSNRSADIHAIFRDGCERVGVRWTAAGPHTTYVSRIADVAVLDEFVGPKR